MDSILDLLGSSQGKELVNGASNQLGLSKAQTASAVSAAMPLLLGALKNNASSQSGAAGLLGALTQHSSGSVLDNLGSILGGNSIDDNVMTDGGKILGHMFGGQQNNAAGAVSKSAGIDLKSAMNIMKIAAPFVMSYLGRQSQQKGVSNQSGLEGLLGGVLGSLGGNSQKAAAQIQDFDNNDSSLEDIAGMILGGKGGGAAGGLGGLLGGLFK